MSELIGKFIVDDREFDELAKLRKMSQEEFDEYLSKLDEENQCIDCGDEIK